MQLAPYLNNVDPITDATFDDLDFLSSLDEHALAANVLLEQILDELRGTSGEIAPPVAPSQPASARGASASAVSYFAHGESASNQTMVDELRALRTSVAQLAEVVDDRLAAHQRATVESQSQGAETVRHAVDQLGRGGPLVRNSA